MDAPAARCPACGYPHDSPSLPCARCGGRVTSPRTAAPPRRVGPGVPLADLTDGFASLWVAAISLVHGREYVGRLWLPVAVNAVALVATFLGLFWGAWSGFEWLLDADWGWLDFLRAPADWVAGVAALVLAAMTVWLVTPVLIETVTSPFLDPLAEATERAWTGRPMPAIDPGAWRAVITGLRASARVLLLQIALLVPLLLLSLTGVGALIAALVAGWFNAVVWFDVPCSRRGYDLPERRALLRRNWARALGFGLAFQLGMFVPIFNLALLTPAAAVATSALYLRFDKEPARRR